MSKNRRDSGLIACIAAASVSEIARAIGTRPQNVSQWRRVPLEHVPALSRLTGLHPQRIRPDYFSQFERGWTCDDKSRGAA